MDGPSTLAEELLRRDRRVVVTVLVLVMILAWTYTLAGVGMPMSAFEMSVGAPEGRAAIEEAMSVPPTWHATHALVMLLMWWIMMIAMMLPGATPVILTAAALNRRSRAARSPFGAAGFFATGYLLAWLCFSAAAVLTQWMLESVGQLSAVLRLTDRTLAAALLVAAGAWQMTPVKRACLEHCRSPVHFLTRYRRPGNRGALVMGMHHGTYCLGCCWFLMTLLFVGGIMDVLWIAGLALFALVEKSFARGVLFGRVAGVALIVAGMVVLVT